MSPKGIKYGKYWDRKCQTCKRQGAFKMCIKHLVKAPDKQNACNDHKYR